MKTIAFFHNKGGVGKTTLVYHLAWMFARRGVSVLAADLDPQANLTAMFLEEDRLEELWPDDDTRQSVLGALNPIIKGLGDVGDPHVEAIDSCLGLLPGDLGLSRFEDKLSDAWPRCHNGDEAAFRTMTAFHRLLEKASRDGRSLVLIDVGPNLGAINRSALIASEHVCLPLAPDLFSIQGLQNLGPTLRQWRQAWGEMTPKAPRGLSMPSGKIDPLGYIVMQHGIHSRRPVMAFKRWMDRIPTVYRSAVLHESGEDIHDVADDPQNLALLKHYHSLMPLAMEARKPIFALTPRDGAIGAHLEAVRNCDRDFRRLSDVIAARVGISFP